MAAPYDNNEQKAVSLTYFNVWQRHTIRITYSVVAIWVITQIVLIAYFWGAPQGSDMGTYIKLARQCFEANEWYPMGEHIYSSYIFAPGFVNYLILQLHIFGTVNFNQILNLLMNIVLLYEVFYLGKKFFSEKTALIAVILFCLLYSNVMVILSAGTEIPFLFLALSGLCLVLHSKAQPLYFVIAGIFFALSNWIRPLALIFVLVALIDLFIKKRAILSFASLLLPMICTVLIIGWATSQKIGYFVYQSTTSGVNLIMSANDKAYGGVMAGHIFKDSTSTLYVNEAEKITFAEKEALYKARAIEWIKAHPAKFAVLYVKKIGGLYVEDSWADRPILGGDGFIGKSATGEVSKKDFMLRVTHMALCSLVYYFVMVCFAVSLWHIRKKLFSAENLLLWLFIFGTAITALFAVSPRYHYPYMFVAILYAARMIPCLGNMRFFKYFCSRKNLE